MKALQEMQILAHGICVLWLQWTNSHRLHSPVQEKGQLGHYSRGEHTDPCLDRLLLLFWAHYIENDPHLLCSVSWVTENKGEDVANYIKEEGYLQM